MEIVLGFVAMLLISAAWVYVRIAQHKIQYGNPKEIEALKAEMDEYKRIINSLDQEGLEVLERRIGELTGQIRENNVKGVLGRK